MEYLEQLGGILLFLGGPFVLGLIDRKWLTLSVFGLFFIGPIVWVTIALAMGAPSPHMSFGQAWLMAMMMIAMGYALMLPMSLLFWFLGRFVRRRRARGVSPGGS